MVAPLVVAGAIVAGQAIAGYLGGQAASKAQREQMQAAAEELARNKAYFESIGVPSVEAQRIVLRKYGLPEDFQPMLEEAVQVGESAMAQVEADPRLQESRLNALAKMENIADTGGMDAQAQLALDQAIEQMRQEESGSRGAAAIAAQRRGIAGGGLEMAQAQQAQQSAANQARREAQMQAAMANQRALQALMGSSEMAGQMSREDIGLKSDQAKAADMIAKWNAAQQAEVQARNVGAQNVADLGNLRGREQVQQRNVDLANAQDQHNKGLIAQNFQQQMDKGRAMAGQGTAAAQMQASQAPVAASQAGAPYQAASESIGALGKMYASGKKDGWWDKDEAANTDKTKPEPKY